LIVSQVIRLIPRQRGGVEIEPLSDDQIVRGLVDHEAFAARALVDQHGPYVRRVIYRVLGADDSEHEDIVQEVFTRAIAGIRQLSSPNALRAWLTQIAVFSARGVIRRRKRSNWLRFLGDLPERAAEEAPASVREAARAVYQIIEKMPVDERIPYTLRAMEGLDLVELASACGVSVATVRRRLAKAEARFARLASGYEALEPWVRST